MSPHRPPLPIVGRHGHIGRTDQGARVGPSSSSSARGRLIPTLAAIAIAASLLAAGEARAQSIRPWVPPNADSLYQWAAQAKARFQANQGDSVGGANYQAYELVGSMGRRLIRSLGKDNLVQAYAIKSVLDSLGLDTDIRVDPVLPQFAFLMVRNPYRFSARAVGFLYWYRGQDLRMQGCLFFGGQRPTIRAWWTGYKEQPYSFGVIDHERGVEGRTRLTLFRLDPAGLYWNVIQYADESPDLTGAGQAFFLDINDDQRPELLAWMHAKIDTLFETCARCPPILQELVLTELEDGFHLHDSRVMPSTYATFTLFIRLLTENNRAAAARLMKHPERMEDLINAGWSVRRGPATWKLELVEPDRPWPTWLVFVHREPKGDQRYTVIFEQREGRWVISDWVKVPPRAQVAPARGGVSLDSTRAVAPKGRGPKPWSPPGTTTPRSRP
jgi:hypothetical protein